MTSKWRSVSEITKCYMEHVESLKMSGVDFDENDVHQKMAKEIADFLVSLSEVTEK